jgi:hypothetical protein
LPCSARLFFSRLQAYFLPNAAMIHSLETSEISLETPPSFMFLEDGDVCLLNL